MNRLAIERRQVWVYLAAIAAGLATGALLPAAGPVFGALLWPVLAALLYATFVQVPLLHLREAFADRRFMAAVLTGNFVLVPLVVWGMVQWLPDELRVEKGFSPDTLKLLEAKGQKVALKEAMGSTQSIMVGPDGELYGASDPRSVDDLTAGY